MSKDPIIQNAADESQLKDARQKERFSQQRLDNAWKFVMASDQGIDVLMDIFAFCKVDQNPMGGADREIFYRIGRQEVGRFMKERMVSADRRKYFETELNLGEPKR